MAAEREGDSHVIDEDAAVVRPEWRAREAARRTGRRILRVGGFWGRRGGGGRWVRGWVGWARWGVRENKFSGRERRVPMVPNNRSAGGKAIWPLGRRYLGGWGDVVFILLG